MLRLDPTNAHGLHGRGSAHALRGEDDRALADFDAALRLDPNLARAYSHRADLHARRGEHEQAEADRREALRLDSNGLGGTLTSS